MPFFISRCTASMSKCNALNATNEDKRPMYELPKICATVENAKLVDVAGAIQCSISKKASNLVSTGPESESPRSTSITVDGRPTSCNPLRNDGR